MIRISIIIALYNGEKYIARCLKSILDCESQNIEIIIVNDGSTDNSLTICDSFAKRDSRIKIVTKVNEGVSAARNLGIQYAKGEYIWFVDADDWITKNAINYLLRMINIYKPDIFQFQLEQKEEFDINQKTFKEITGQTSKLIRLPFGSKPYTSRASYNAIVNAGYKLWDWTLDTEDWKSTSPQIVETIKKHTHDTDNIVLLIHERKQTVAVLDEIIKYFKKEGFEILPIKQSDEERNYWNGKLFS